MMTHRITIHMNGYVQTIDKTDEEMVKATVWAIKRAMFTENGTFEHFSDDPSLPSFTLSGPKIQGISWQSFDSSGYGM